MLVEKFRRLLCGEEKGYAEHAWQELAQVASDHYEPICTSCGDMATRWGCEECS